MTRNYITPFLGSCKVRDLRPSHLNALLTRLAREKSERIVWSAHVVLRAALNFAVREGLLPVNPCNSVVRPKRQQKKPQPLTREQTVLFLREADNEALRALFILAVETGLRSGEILGLKLIDFDQITRMLAVRRQARVRKSDRDAGRKTCIELVERTNTGRARSLLLSDTATAALLQHIKHFAAERNPNPYGLLFPGADGAPMQRSTLNRIFRRILGRAKLPLIRFHDLRHTAATLLLLQGVHPKIAQERLGHTNIAMTLDRYSAWTPSLQADAGRRYEQYPTRL